MYHVLPRGYVRAVSLPSLLMSYTFIREKGILLGEYKGGSRGSLSAPGVNEICLVERCIASLLEPYRRLEVDIRQLSEHCWIDTILNEIFESAVVPLGQHTQQEDEWWMCRPVCCRTWVV